MSKSRGGGAQKRSSAHRFHFQRRESLLDATLPYFGFSRKEGPTHQPGGGKGDGDQKDSKEATEGGGRKEKKTSQLCPALDSGGLAQKQLQQKRPGNAQLKNLKVKLN